MNLFHIIEDVQIVLRSNGGFIRIGAGDAISDPNVYWEGIDREFPKDLNGNPLFPEE